MGLTYPAGREIDQLAHQGADIYDFPRAMIKEDNLEFSFSGSNRPLSICTIMRSKKEKASPMQTCQRVSKAAVLDILMAKTKKALEKYQSKP